MNPAQTSIRQLPLSEAETIWNTIVKDEIFMPMYSFQWYKTWLSINTEWKSYALLIDNKTIAPFVRKDDLVQSADKYTDYNDLIGSKHNVWPAILEFLKHDGIKKIHWENIPQTSESISFFKKLSEANQYNCIIEAAKSSPILPLPNTFEEYLVSIREKRKKYNRFLREYPQAILRISEYPEVDIDHLITLMKKNPIKQASFTPQKEAFFKAIALQCKDVIRLLLLQIDNEIIAAQLMFVFKDTTMVYISGYDSQYANVGTYLLIVGIKQAIEEGKKTYNFLIGKELYKYEMGAKDFFLYTVDIQF